MSREFFDNVTTAGGIILPERTKLICRWCGAAFDKRGNDDPEEGVRAHELQCRHGVKQRFLQAALSGPLVEKGGEAIVDTVESVLAAVDAQERATWKERF